ncbi:MAG: hypothetical protein JXR12_06635 [Neptunomonas phycophila]|uniref:hypothetical protein n=1 Tax=Neptunomonas phycophila TaxID=1572645 RepID=UPI003B8C4AAB
MNGELINLTLNTPIHEIPNNKHLNLDGGDIVVSLDEQSGNGTYTVRVEDTANTDKGLMYTVMDDESRQFAVPKEFIVSIGFPTEDEQMDFGMALNANIYRDEMNAIAQLIVRKMYGIHEDGLSPGGWTEHYEYLQELVQARRKEKGQFDKK